VLAVGRADAGVAVDRAEAHDDRFPAVWPAAVDVAAADRAERLDVAAAGRRPLGDQLLAGVSSSKPAKKPPTRSVSSPIPSQAKRIGW